MISYERAIARVERSGKVLGAAFLVTDRHLLTCGHVVGAGGNDVELSFLANPDLGPVPARVTALINEKNRDIAVLLLHEQVPKTSPAPLARWTEGRTFRATGFPDGRLEGDPVDGKLQGTTLFQVVKLEGTSDRKIARQFSGTCVWSETHDAVVGMVVSIYNQEPTAYMIPMERIGEALEHLHPEVCRHIFRELSEADAGTRGTGWQHISSAEVEGIKACLHGFTIADETAQTLFYEVAPFASLPVGLDGGKLFLNALATLARRPADQLLTYVLRGLAQADQAPPPSLREILKRIASRFALDLEKIGEAARPSTQTLLDTAHAILQIRVAPGLLSDGECLVDAWLREDASIHPVMETLELVVDQLREGLPEIVRRAQQQLRNRRSDLQVEVTLPLTLVGCDLDCWPVKFGAKKKALGSCRQLCVRPYERLYNPEYNMTWFSWEERWKAKPAGVAEPQHVLWDDGQTKPETSLAGGQSILVTLRPLTCERLADFVSEGIPIALWPRMEIGDDSAIQLELREILYDDHIDGLPQRVREKRRSAHTAEVESPWMKIPLLWDSPENLPPGALPGADEDFWPLTAPE